MKKDWESDIEPTSAEREEQERHDKVTREGAGASILADVFNGEAYRPKVSWQQWKERG